MHQWNHNSSHSKDSRAVQLPIWATYTPIHWHFIFCPNYIYHITGSWTPTNMHVIHSLHYSGSTSSRHHGNNDTLHYDTGVCYQITVKWFITQFWTRNALPCACVDVFWDYFSYRMIYYTRHMKTDVLHCVYTDACSNYFFYKRIYYKHHTNMDALHYVCVYGFSNLVVLRTIYCKHHSNMGVLRYVCPCAFSDYFACRMICYTHHRNTDALHYVCADVFSDHFV